jgi:hypothetical protein
VTSVIAASSYHRQQDFLNKGYLVPFDSIATYASGSLATGGGLLVIDTSNMDATPLLAALPPAVPALLGRDDASGGEIRRRIDAGAVERVWFLRNTHDVSPDRWSGRLAEELARSFRCVHRSGYVAYGAVDRLAMRAFGWPDRPAHVLELLEFERTPVGAASSRTPSTCPSAGLDRPVP